MSYLPLDTPAVLAFPLTGIQLIEASAGTGKTYTIANLYLRHIVAGRTVGEVLVVTFTKAATDELRGRIRARLFETLECLEHDRRTADAFLTALLATIRDQGQEVLTVKRLRLAVRAMDESAIFTIHSFCQRALTEFAFNSGQQFEMEVLTDDRALWDQAVADWWRRTGYPLDPARLRLFSTGLGSLEAFRSLLAPLLGAQERRLIPDVGPLAAVLERFDAMVPRLTSLATRWRAECHALTETLLESTGLSRAQTSPYCVANLQSALAVIDDYFAAELVLPPPDAFAVLTPETITAHRLRKPDPNLEAPFFADCGQVWQALKTLRRDLRAAALAEAAAFATTRVKGAKQQAQVLSFDDLLTEMYQALQRPGDALADSIRQQFPVAMIDEFQDTDPVQYGIFRRLYLGQPDLGLIMIGDPKQAIYSFRGGDIFTYMQAKEDLGSGSIYTLTTNWRSTPNVINAVNTLFCRRGRDAFVYADTIPFVPIDPADKEHRFLLHQNEPQPALTLWTLPAERTAKGEAKPLSKESARTRCHQAVAAEIARLIAGGRAGRTCLGTRPLEPKDIAVLVRTGYEAAELRRALAALGVNAVAVERDGVFRSAEAPALETLLQAVLNPRDRDLARLALTSALLGKDYVEVERITHSEDDWVAWVDQLLQFHQTWQRKGFMAMFQQLLRGLDIARALSRDALAERRLTNLLHLGELLQQASKAHAGMDALLTWYRQQQNASATEEAELRLESDEALVQIVTIHASKGLEYPVVFVPYLWGCTLRNLDGLLGFHQDQVACLDAGSDDLQSHLLLAEQERLAEDVRVAYVALTRAASALYLIWGRAGSGDGHAGQTALGYLLHPHQQRDRLGTERPDAFAGLADLQPDLQALATAAGGDILLTPLPKPADSGPGVPAAAAPPALAPRPFAGRIANDWRVTSFSALTRDVHSGPSAPRDQSADDCALGFPAGTEVGSYLHLLLEKLDFRTTSPWGDIAQQVLRHSAQIAPRFNLDHTRWGQDAATWLAQVIHTPLDGTGLSLAQLGPAQRLNELEFDFATHPVNITALNRLLDQAAGQPLPPLAVDTFQGLVTGVIDLVFEHQGRFYIADYKSNFLGGQLTDYSADRLRATMVERRYDLQYLLYTLALHRYLRQRLADYDYEKHFGGVYYLFLRGMRPPTGARFGVYHTRPDLHLVDTLDRRIFHCEPGDTR